MMSQHFKLINGLKYKKLRLRNGTWPFCQENLNCGLIKDYSCRSYHFLVEENYKKKGFMILVK